MADEKVDPPVQQAQPPEPPTQPEPPGAPTQPAAAPGADKYDALAAKLDALTDSFQATMAHRATQMQHGQPSQPGAVNPAVRQMLKGSGLTDADIDANAPLIVPFLQVAGAEVRQAIDSVRDEVELARASQDRKRYPDWEAVAPTVEKLREDAMKQGRALSVRQAYEAAVVTDLDKVAAARAQRRTASAATDIGNQTVQHVGTSAHRAPAQPTSAKDLAGMSREERAKFYERFGDLPIQ